MGEYNHNGKQVLHDEGGAITHIADAADVEKAHFLTTAANEYSFDYIEEANKTLSHEFHGELVHENYFRMIVSNAINCLNGLDAIKKALFYGKTMSTLGRYGGPDMSSFLESFNKRLIGFPGDDTSKAADLLHGIIGAATEAGELLEVLLSDGPIDLINIIEEVGDEKWYLAAILKAIGVPRGDDERLNIAKLKQRYPDKFQAKDAITRDLTAERKVLEGERADAEIYSRLGVDNPNPAS